jgi:hypothetical protein
MVIKGKYTARLHKTFSAAAEGTYFVRTDEETIGGADSSPSARLLGGELYGTLLWGPTSDFMATLGGGAFFPGWGDAAPDSPVQWKILAGILFSL